jgi:hypothetical protein
MAEHLGIIDKSGWPNGMDVYCQPLAQFAKELNPKNILEIGIGWDGYSSAMFLENCDALVTMVDKRDWGKKGELYNSLFPERYTFIEGRSENVLPTLKRAYDLIFIDGNHSYEGCKADIINCIPLLKKGGVLLLDDYGITSSDTAVDLDDGSGADICAPFGVYQAADEVLADWKQVYTHINFANGGRAYVAPVKSR